VNTIEGALYTYLSARPAIAAYVGGTGTSPATEARIYPVKMPQNVTLPAISFFTVYGESEFSIDATQVGLGYKRIQISAWHTSLTTAKAIIEALRLLMAGYRGLWDDVNVRVVQFSIGPDLYEEDTKIYQIPCQITLWHDEPTS
jgi:hypothetical protein